MKISVKKDKKSFLPGCFEPSDNVHNDKERQPMPIGSVQHLISDIGYIQFKLFRSFVLFSFFDVSRLETGVSLLHGGWRERERESGGATQVKGS